MLMEKSVTIFFDTQLILHNR